MLRWRLLSASVIVSVLAALLWLDLQHNFGHVGIWLAPLLILIGVLAGEESMTLLRVGGHTVNTWAVRIGVFLTIAASCAPTLWTAYPEDCPLGKLGWTLSAFAVSLLGVFLTEMKTYQQPGQSIHRLAMATLVIGYVGVLGSFIAHLRLFHDNHWGMVAMISVILVVKASDAGAYALGRTLGRTKMSPLLSPGKTVEGAVGGITCACVSGWLFFAFVVPHIVGADQTAIAWWQAVVYSLIVSLFGMLGDLAESLLKRDAGQKDSGRWLPGLGGVLDVLDSILAAAPPAFLCWVLGLIGPK